MRNTEIDEEIKDGVESKENEREMMKKVVKRKKRRMIRRRKMIY